MANQQRSTECLWKILLTLCHLPKALLFSLLPYHTSSCFTFPENICVSVTISYPKPYSINKFLVFLTLTTMCFFKVLFHPIGLCIQPPPPSLAPPVLSINTLLWWVPRRYLTSVSFLYFLLKWISLSSHFFLT